MYPQIPDFNPNDAELYGFGGSWGIEPYFDDKPIDNEDENESH